MLPMNLILVAFQLVAAAKAIAIREQGHITIPLKQHPGPINLFSHSRYAVLNRNSQLDTPDLPVEPETEHGGFWYGALDVGEAENLSLLIDTGSSDLAVNPNRYSPTNDSQKLHKTGNLIYDTTEADGCGSANISYSVYKDTVRMAGLEAQNQAFANVIQTQPSGPGVLTRFPHDGLVGFARARPKNTQLHETTFFKNLCLQGQVSECRFGLAFGTDGEGQQILGGVDEELFEGSLSSVSLEGDFLWKVLGQVAVNGKVVPGSHTMIFDSGTANIVGPIEQVRSLFEKLGIQAVEESLPDCTSVLFGYYPCDSTVQVGLRSGSYQPVFDILTSAFQQKDNGGNNCTALITGIDLKGASPVWVIGQAWFQGKYVDFDLAGNTVGVANLKSNS